MVQEKNFSIMCSEILEILKYCPKSDIDKLPKKLINLLNNNKDVNHKVEIDPNKSVFEQQITEETIVMIFIIFRNYWASQEEKKEIYKILRENEIKLNDFYAYNKIFKHDKGKARDDLIDETIKKETISKEQSFKKITVTQDIINESNNSKNNNIELIEYKESFIKRFISAIKKFF